MSNVMGTNTASDPGKNKIIGIGVVSIIAIIAIVIIYQIFSSFISFPLQGKWYYGDSAGTYSLEHAWVFEDGAYKEVEGNNVLTGTYKVLDRGTEGKVEITSNAQVTEYTYVVKDGLAELTKNGQGRIVYLKKAD